MKERRSKTSKAQRRRPCQTAAEWNAEHQVGTEVRFMPVLGDETYEYSKTRSEAWELGNGTPLVKIESRAGGVALDHLIIISWQFWLDNHDNSFLLVRSPAVRANLFEAIVRDNRAYQMDFVSTEFLRDCRRIEEGAVSPRARAALLAVRWAA